MRALYLRTFWLWAAALGGFSSLSVAELYQPPRTFLRSEGAPKAEFVRIGAADLDSFEQPLRLFLRNGDEEGERRVPSALVTLDEERLFVPSDFSAKAPILSSTVVLTEQSILRLELRGQPGGEVTVWVEGDLKPGRARITPDGGVVQDAAGELTLRIPAGALSEPQIIGLERVPAEAIGDVTADMGVGPAYRVLPAGLLLERAATVSWSFAALFPEDAEYPNLGVVHWDSDGRFLEVLASTTDSAAKEVNFHLAHFSFLRLVVLSAVTTSPKGTWAVFDLVWRPPQLRWFLEETDIYQTPLSPDVVEAALQRWSAPARDLRFERVSDRDSANLIFEDVGHFKIGEFFACGTLGSQQRDYFLDSPALLWLYGGITCFEFGLLDLLGSRVLGGDDQVIVRLASEGMNQAQGEGFLLHEIGHALGLAHPWSREETPVMSEAGHTMADLHTWDREALCFKYECVQGDFRAAPRVDYEGTITHLSTGRTGRILATARLQRPWSPLFGSPLACFPPPEFHFLTPGPGLSIRSEHALPDGESWSARFPDVRQLRVFPGTLLLDSSPPTNWHTFLSTKDLEEPLISFGFASGVGRYSIDSIEGTVSVKMRHGVRGGLERFGFFLKETSRSFGECLYTVVQ